MQAYIGVNVAMGFKDLPEYNDYCATDPILHDPFISYVLSHQRYEKLCQYLLCSILANKQAGDKLAKIRPLITLCETNFRQCFVPLQNLSIDIPTLRTVEVHRSFGYTGSKDFNSLPLNLKSLKEHKYFQRETKEHFSNLWCNEY